MLLSDLIGKETKRNYITKHSITMNHCKVEQLGYSPRYQYIQILHLTGNRLRSLEGIEEVYNNTSTIQFLYLKNLSISHNLISRVDELFRLKSPTLLTFLSCHHNPFASNPSHQSIVLSRFTDLRDLDGIKIDSLLRRGYFHWVDINTQILLQSYSIALNPSYQSQPIDQLFHEIQLEQKKQNPSLVILNQLFTKVILQIRDTAPIGIGLVVPQVQKQVLMEILYHLEKQKCLELKGFLLSELVSHEGVDLILLAQNDTYAQDALLLEFMKLIPSHLDKSSTMFPYFPLNKKYLNALIALFRREWKRAITKNENQIDQQHDLQEQEQLDQYFIPTRCNNYIKNNDMVTQNQEENLNQDAKQYTYEDLQDYIVEDKQNTQYIENRNQQFEDINMGTLTSYNKKTKSSFYNHPSSISVQSLINSRNMIRFNTISDHVLQTQPIQGIQNNQLLQQQDESIQANLSKSRNQIQQNQDVSIQANLSKSRNQNQNQDISIQANLSKSRNQNQQIQDISIQANLSKSRNQNQDISIQANLSKSRNQIQKSFYEQQIQTDRTQSNIVALKYFIYQIANMGKQILQLRQRQVFYRLKQMQAITKITQLIAQLFISSRQSNLETLFRKSSQIPKLRGATLTRAMRLKCGVLRILKGLKQQRLDQFVSILGMGERAWNRQKWSFFVRWKLFSCFAQYQFSLQQKESQLQSKYTNDLLKNERLNRIPLNKTKSKSKSKSRGRSKTKKVIKIKDKTKTLKIQSMKPKKKKVKKTIIINF